MNRVVSPGSGPAPGSTHDRAARRKRLLANSAINLSLLFVSLLCCAVVIELVLRFAYPVYEAAARPRYEHDDLRIWAPRANSVADLPHPDTGATHLVIHNNLALRQSRNFDDLASAVNVGFFGDSYTANDGLPAAYSFTEPLDYLLNTSGAHFNVLNFGVNGYGTDQAYLAYQGFAQRKRLKHVLYLLCANDLRNIYETNLFSLNARGELVRNPTPKPAWWVKPLARLHITYLVLDLRQRLFLSRKESAEEYRAALEQRSLKKAHGVRLHAPRAESLQRSLLRGEVNPDLSRTVAIFQQLMRQWKSEVEASGAKFYVVLLPTGREEIFKPLLGEEYKVIDLLDSFRQSAPDFEWRTIQFKHDNHWAEEGNRLAARALYQALAADLDIPARSSAELDRSLATYYAAFSQGWRPTTAAVAAAAPAEELAKIRQKYIALELSR